MILNQLEKKYNTSNIMIIFVLYAPRDVALAKILLETSPVDIKVLVPNFKTKDQYNWKKRKTFTNHFTFFEKIKLKKELGPLNLKIVWSKGSFIKQIKEADLVIDRGQTFFIFKPIARNNVALSLNRCYFNRLLDVIPHYKESQLKIYMHSDMWLDSDKNGSFMMEGHSYNTIKDNIANFSGIDILGYNYDLLKKEDKLKLKNEFNLPEDKKIVLVSFRKCVNPNWSVFQSNDEFIASVKENLIKLKNKGYYVISRRRMGKHDLAAYKTLNSPDISRFDEVSYLIDLEFNDGGGYPDLLYRLLYVSDLLYLPDISGIASVEAALTRCPVYMPYKEEWKNNQCVNINPATKDMVYRNLIFNDLSESSINYYNVNITKFLADWYNTDIEGFWKSVLK